MNEERILVLEMLQAGKIDVSQADELLDSLELASAATPPAATPPAAPPALPAAAKPTALRLSPDQLLTLKNHDIDARFIRSVQDLGLKALSFDDILELGVHEVPPKFIRELRESFPEIAVSQIVELYNHDIDTDFLRELRDAELLSANPKSIIGLKEERDQSSNA